MSRMIPFRAMAVLVLFWQANGVADIIYVDPPDIPLFGVSTPAVYDLDLDDNGVIDFTFTSDGFQFYLDPQSNNRAAVNLANNLAARPAGTLFSMQLPPDTIWSAADLIGITACATFPHGGVCIGEFVGQTAFMGVEFDIVGGSTHYGWVQLDVDGSFPGGFLLDYAYESTPDQGIAAGAIPEPSTFLLTLLGLFVFGLRTRSGSRLWTFR